VIAVALAGCVHSNPNKSTDPDDCGCINGWVCCGTRVCAPSQDQCTVSPPDMAPQQPDMTPPPPGQLVFSTVTVSFPATTVGSTAAPLSVTVSNHSSEGVTFNSLNLVNNGQVLTHDDLEILPDSTCRAGTTLAPGASCAIDLDYTPSRVGFENILLSVDTTSAKYLLWVGGTATPTKASLLADPTSLAFGVVWVGQTPALTVNVSNRGSGPTGKLGVSASDGGTNVLSASGCEQALPEGGECRITVVFTPRSEGSYFGSVALGDGTQAGTLIIPVTAGAVSPAQLSVSMPGPFPDEWLNEASPPQTFHVTNHGEHPTGVVNIPKPSSSFVIDSDGCSGQPLGAGLSCDVVVHFVAVKHGNNLDHLYANALPGGMVGAILQGHGKQHATLTAAGDGNVKLSTTTGAATQQLVITNSGDETSGAITWQFAGGASSLFSASGCTTPLTAGASCTAKLSFNTAIAGTFKDTLTISDGPRNQLAENMSGTFTSAGVLVPSASSLNLDKISQPTLFPTVTVWNTGAQASGTLTTTITGSGFSAASDGCNGTVLQPGTTCSVQVKFTPSFTGTFPGSLVIGDGTNSATVSLSAGALVPAFSFNPAKLDFGTVGIGQASAPVSVVITNSSNRDAPASYTIDNDTFWVVGGNCPATLTVAASCTLSLRFGPRSGGSFSGNLTFGGTEGVPTLPLTGAGQ
jgi:hypothetical protein